MIVVERQHAVVELNLAGVTQAVLRATASIPFDDGAAIEYGQVRAHPAAVGTPIAVNDFLVAPIALGRRWAPVAHKWRECERVPALVAEEWEGV